MQVSVPGRSTTLFLLALTLAVRVQAGPLEEADVRRVVNQVAIVAPDAPVRAAAVGDTIKGDLGVETGIRSRAELLFQDNTLTRLGPETFFSFEPGTRDLTLKQGTMLLQVPKNIGGAKIHTAAVTAAILGTTIMIEYLPGRNLKVVVLEGTLRLSLNQHLGEAILLHPGKMVIMHPDAKRIPDPVDIDLQNLVKTSRLVNPDLFKSSDKDKEPPLPSIGLIEKEIAIQGASKQRNGLFPTNLVILGEGTNLSLLGNQQIAALNKQVELQAKTDPESSQPIPTPASRPRSKPTPIPTPPPVATPTPTPIPHTGPGPLPTPNVSAAAPGPSTVTPADAPPVGISLNGPITGLTTITTGLFPTISNGHQVAAGTTYKGAAVDGPAGDFLFGSESTFMGQIGFDQQFGYGAGPSGVTVFKIANLNMVAPPVILSSGGAADLALISTGSLIFNDKSAVWNIGGLNSLFLGSNNGDVDLKGTGTIGAASGSSLSYLSLFSNGAITTESGLTISLPAAELIVNANGNVSMGASVNAATVDINSMSSMQISGPINANFVQLWSKGGTTISGGILADTFYDFANNLTVNGQISSPYINIQTAGNLGPGGANSTITGKNIYLNIGATANLNAVNTNATRFNLANVSTFGVTANQVNFSSNFELPAGAAGSLQAGQGGISGGNFNVAGFNYINSAGNINLGSLTTSRVTVTNGNIALSGNLTADAITASGNVQAGGAIAPETVNGPSVVRSISAKNVTAGGGLNYSGANAADATSAGRAGYQLTLTSPGSITIDTGAINGANFNGGAALASGAQAGGDGGVFDLGTEVSPIGGNITVNKPVTATTGSNGSGAATGGKGGTVSMVSNGSVTVNAPITVSRSASGSASSSGGNVNIESKATGGTAISVTNSGQILALLSNAAPGPGGTITFTSAGGNIAVNGATIQADKGTIAIQNNAATNGQINLTNANLSANIVKAQTLGSNGQLNINGGSISANSLIELYAPGSNGTVTFSGNVSLNGNSVKTIAGNTVTITNNSDVNVGGSQPANVFTNNGNYTGSGGNGSTSGKFSGAGATTQPFANRPSF